MGTPGKPIPEGHHTVTPYLIIKGADKAIEFYKKAFGAVETARMPGPDGKTIVHAQIMIGDTPVYLTEENPEWGASSPQTLNGTPVSMHIYVEDVDTFFKRAIDAGATETMPVNDVFWGDRYGKLKDPFGHEWGIATHKTDLTTEEIQKGAQEFFSQMASK